MTPSKLVFKSLTRRKGRFVFTLLGIMIGMGLVVFGVTAYFRPVIVVHANGNEMVVSNPGSLAEQE